MTDNIHYLFNPRTVAIVGASRNPNSIGREILKNILELNFEGRVYPVNPNAYSVNSLRCYESLSAIPDQIDLAIIVVPAKYVKEVMEEAVSLGVKAAVIITAGFKEIGEKGAQLEAEIAEIARKGGMRVVGPNCMGILNGHAPYLNATFAPVKPLPGNIGFISQSGALGVVIMKYATQLKLGFSKFVSLGNKMDVNANHMLQLFMNDDDTKVILGYLEAFSDPGNFSSVARAASKKKPILMVKSGRTPQGARAASSHTGALAGQEYVVSAAMKGSGIIRVNSVKELFDSAIGFLKAPLPKGKRVAILTNSGGPGTLATDTLISLGMEIAELTESTLEKLRKVIPPEASPLNPVDLIASANAERYKETLKILLEDENVDSVILIFVPPLMIQAMEVAQAVNPIIKASEKPVLGCFMGRDIIRESDLDVDFPIFDFPESAARVLKDMYTYYQWRETPIEEPVRLVKDQKSIKRVATLLKKGNPGELLDPRFTQEIFELYGLRFPETKIVYTSDDLLAEAKKIGFPVVVKVASPKIEHKTDAGGVFLDIRNFEELIDAWLSIQDVYDRNKVPEEDRPVMVQKFYQSGVELAMGSTFDRQFGNVLMIGSGGILIELLKDVVFRLAPISRRDAEEMITQIRGYPLLLGFRGEPPSDIEALIDALLRVNQLVVDHPQIKEIDINPILALPKGQKPVILDARITL
ncbi:MAG: CoA-binding protein [Methanobacteriota archaeon]|nr:MAG: CoA-binding protein [Euryarchaeota archaeon]